MDYEVLEKLEQEIREEKYRINNDSYSNYTKLVAESYLSGMIDTIRLMGYEVHGDKIIRRDKSDEIELNIL